jgi:hypothetical protein
VHGANQLLILAAVGFLAAIGGVIGAALAQPLKLTGGGKYGAGAVGAGLAAVVGFFAVAPGSMTALGSLAPKVGAAYDAVELERVLKAYYPSDYRQVQSTLAALKARHASEAETVDALGAIEIPLMARRLPLASSKNTLAYIDLVRDEQAVLAQDPELCLRVMENPGPGSRREMNAAMPDALKRREMRLAIKVLEQTAVSPQQPRPSRDVDQKMQVWSQDAVGSLGFDGRGDLAGASGTVARAKASCKVFGSLLQIMAGSSPDDAVEVYKALAEKGAQRTGG